MVFIRYRDGKCAISVLKLRGVKVARGLRFRGAEVIIRTENAGTKDLDLCQREAVVPITSMRSSTMQSILLARPLLCTVGERHARPKFPRQPVRMRDSMRELVAQQ
jgi:hypothetical protein